MQKVVKYLIWFGILILAAGFLFAVIFVNIPPQDPPEDVMTEYNRLAAIADWIFTIGLVITGVGAVLRVVNRLMRTKSR
jgi:hypothetical protein